MCAGSKKVAHEAAFLLRLHGKPVANRHIFMLRSCVGAVSSCGHVNGDGCIEVPAAREKQAIDPAIAEHVVRTLWMEPAMMSFLNAPGPGTSAELSRSCGAPRERIGLRELVIVAQFCDPEETT